MRKRYVIALPLALLVLVLDQASKILVLEKIRFGEAIPVIPDFFDLVHVLNRGSAFGFLNTPDFTWQRYVFIGISCLAVVVILFMLRSAKDNEHSLFIGLGLILGGALGNLVDRVQTGMVIDFLDFYLGAYHWPAFNVADSAISIGAVALVISFYKQS